MFARRQELLEQRGGARRRPRGHRRRHERGGSRARRRDRGRDLRRDRHPREQLGRPAARDRERARAPSRSEAAVDLLLVSIVRLTGLCLPHLERSPAGRIVTVTSSTVREPIDNLVLSNVVRPGIVGWSKSLARELGPKGITVNCIAPGRIDTDRIREVYPDGPTEDDLAANPAAPARHDARDRRRRGVPVLGARVVRQRHGDPRGRRTHPRSVVTPA